MNPLTVTVFDINRSQAVTQFLNMCTTSSATAAAIYDTMDKTLVRLLKSTNPWTMHTSVGAYNTSVNIDTRNFLQTRIVKRNDAVYFNWCPCHIIHNPASNRHAGFAKHCSFDVEEFAVDLFYWFDKSTKRKNELQSYNEFCNPGLQKIIKSTKVLMPQWGQEPCAHAQLDALPYFRNACK